MLNLPSVFLYAIFLIRNRMKATTLRMLMRPKNDEIHQRMNEEEIGSEALEGKERSPSEGKGGGVSVDVSVSVPFFVIKKLGSCIL